MVVIRITAMDKQNKIIWKKIKLLITYISAKRASMGLNCLLVYWYLIYMRGSPVYPMVRIFTRNDFQ